jgi:CheY-like chemotaxis protein
LYFITAIFLAEIGDNLFWLSVYPIVALLSTKKKANLFSFIFILVAMILMIFIPSPETQKAQYSGLQLTTFLFSYLAIFSVLYTILKAKQNQIRFKDNTIYQLQDELKDKEEFISKVSHQIRTPLNNIVVVSNMLNPSELGDQAKDYFDTILASTNNLVDVVNSFSDITNLDVEQHKKSEIIFDLNSTLQNTKNLFVDKESDNSRQPISISSDVDYTLVGDPVKVKQIFLNLIEQILKHSRTKQIEITITDKTSEDNEDFVEIDFELSTMGLQHIDNEIREKSKTSKARKIMDKLELQIAERTIKSLGGKLEIQPQPEKYHFHFTLQFKKADKSAKKESAEEGVQEREEKEKTELKDANVLLVEDNLINQKIVLLSLKKAVKNVDLANNGKEALDKFGSVKYDIILMDIQMPVMNGIVTTQKIRNIEKSTNTHTPIIAITANALLGDKEECLEAGTDDYISKPFQIETLLDKMKKLL